ncbi:tyrosine-type recombinase/integrase [Waterburya agarophytonicola K14]|uniref:Tyrosine-type recombinase/integrase n=1 Tax=Waterburya agarophytonicola KI4 TaxID=2874699 RepID=A0A964BSN3_9CYAN|nr:tyrosine-type recombinase/integrase [Waterburya agarophytonicola]MCC0177803.1 tyrosine-type recombinase/integrase [Waterburya agarophytonicola KI4]
MYLDQDNWKGKVGRINILRRGNSLRLRFTYPAHNRIEITIAKATETGWQETIRVANLIERDIQLEDFDDTLQRYGYKQTQSISVSSKKPNLKVIWESYKEANKNRVAPTTIKHCWNEMDRYINLVPSSLLKTEKAAEFINHLLSIYKPSSLAGIFRASLYPAASQAVKQGVLTRNVYRDVELPKTAKKKIECFEKFEIEAIIAAFYSDEYKSKKSGYLHSFYAPLVEFLCITGARPEEAHALTWDDIKRKKDKTYVRFNKAYSNKILLPHTKTREIRLLSANERLRELLRTMPVVENEHDLIFPAVGGGYINQGGWRSSYWKRVINGLVDDDKIYRYLKPYCLRHSAITSWIRQGYDPATVAAWAGTSTKMICDHYLAAKDSFDIPEL